MKTVLVVTVFAALTVFAFVVVVMNRSSEKIVSTVIPLSLGAFVTLFLTVFYLGRQPIAESTFPVSFLYLKDSNLPVTIPFRRLPFESLFLVPQLASKHPELVKDGHDGVALYDELLQRAMIGMLTKYYATTWRIQIDRFDTGFRETSWRPVDPGDHSGTLLEARDIRGKLMANRFANEFFFDPKIVLPPGTTLTASPPRSEGGGLGEARIQLQNRFLTLTITTRVLSWGPFHNYDAFFSNADEMDKVLVSANFVVTTRASFNRWLSGHPDMPKYKAWSGQVSSELQQQFDEELVWKEAKDRFLFKAQREGPGPVNATFKTLKAPSQ